MARGGAGRREARVVLVLAAVLIAGAPARAQTVIRGGVAERSSAPAAAPAPLARALAEADRHPDRRAVVAAIRRAGRASGVGDGYLLGTAALESGFRPDARSARSTALGPFQFLESTWLDTMSVGIEADAARPLGGRVVPADEAARRRALLALRRDPEAAAAAALRFTEANRRRLKDAFGREPAKVDLYLAHLLGAAGAVRFLALLDRRPDAAAQPWFRKAARTNPGLFLGRDGRALSLRAVRDRLNAYFDAPADGGVRRGGARVVRVTERRGGLGVTSPGGSRAPRP